MVKKWISGIAVAALLALAAVGGVSAVTKGGPVTLFSPDRVSEKGDRAADAGHAAQEATPTASPEPKDNGSENEPGDSGNEANGQGAQRIAGLIASQFGVSASEVMSLHDQGIGFGALLKLYEIAKAKGISVQDLLASLPQGTDGHEFAFGKLMNDLTTEQQAALQSQPKNLGALVSGHATGGSPGHGKSKNK